MASDGHSIDARQSPFARLIARRREVIARHFEVIARRLKGGTRTE
jgi:hypothetical protein